MAFIAVMMASGCGFYFKAYRSREPFPFVQGTAENDVLSQWGSPLSVQIVGPALTGGQSPLDQAGPVQSTGPMQVWRYFAEEPRYGKKKTYTLVWFQNGKVLKWETTEEENLPAKTGTSSPRERAGVMGLRPARPMS